MQQGSPSTAAAATKAASLYKCNFILQQQRGARSTDGLNPRKTGNGRKTRAQTRDEKTRRMVTVNNNLWIVY